MSWIEAERKLFMQSLGKKEKGKGEDDMIHLKILSEEVMLKNLAKRFEADIVYVRVVVWK
jgi:myosin heavy subunit